MSKSSNSADGGKARDENAEKKKLERQIKDALKLTVKAWNAGRPTTEATERFLYERISDFRANNILSELLNIKAGRSEHSEKQIEAQKERILYALRISGAINEIRSDVQNLSTILASPKKTPERKEAEKQMESWEQWFHFCGAELGYQFPELKLSYQILSISLHQTSNPNDLVAQTIAPYLEGKADAVDAVILGAIRPSEGIVLGMGSRTRISSILQAASKDGKNTAWAIDYLMDCASCAPEHKRPQAIMNLLLESANHEAFREEVKREAKSLFTALSIPHQQNAIPLFEKNAGKAKAGTPEAAQLNGFVSEVKTMVGKPPQMGGPSHGAPEGTGRKVDVDETAILTPTAIRDKFVRGDKVALDELPSDAFRGQPARRILNAATLLMDVNVKDPEQEGVRNRMVEVIVLDNLPAEFRHIVNSYNSKLMHYKFTNGFDPDSASTTNLLRSVVSKANAHLAELEASTGKANLLLDPDALVLRLQTGGAIRSSELDFSALSLDEAKHLLRRLNKENIKVEQGILELNHITGILSGITTQTHSQPAHEAAAKPKAPPEPESKRKTKETISFPENDRAPELLQAIGDHTQDKKPRKAALKNLRAALSEEKRLQNPELIAAISRYLLHEEQSVQRNAVATLVSLAELESLSLLDAHDITSRLGRKTSIEAQEVLAQKIAYGSAAEMELSLAALALVRERALDSISRPSIAELAVEELARVQDEKMVIPALFRLSEAGLPHPLLLNALANSNKAMAGAVAINLLEAPYARALHDLFSAMQSELSTPGIPKSGGSEKFAEAYLNLLGGAENEITFSAVAKGAASLGTPAAAAYLILRMNDSSWEEEISAFAEALKSMDNKEPDKLLRRAFGGLTADNKLRAIDILAARAPYAAQVQFLLLKSYSEEKEIAEKCRQPLVNMDLSGLDAENQFTLAHEMLAHKDAGVAKNGIFQMKAFLARGNEALGPWAVSAVIPLAEIFSEHEDTELAKAAGDFLAVNSQALLKHLHHGGTVKEIFPALESDNETASTLAMFAAAWEMCKGPFSEELSTEIENVSREFTDEGKREKMKRMLGAAHIASTQESLSQILVPSLSSSDRKMSGFAAELLLESQAGMGQLVLAAAGKNHPQEYSNEAKERILRAAFIALMGADTREAAEGLVSLLSAEDGRTRLFAQRALKEAGESKIPVLLSAISSEDERIVSAAIHCLPSREELVREMFPLMLSDSVMVSGAAVEAVARMAPANQIAEYLSDTSISEAIRQEIANRCSESPGVSGVLLSQAKEEGEKGVKALVSLGFIPDWESVSALLSALSGENADKANAAKHALLYMCELLEGIDQKSYKSLMLLVPEIYAGTTDSGIHDAAKAAAMGNAAPLLREAVLENMNDAKSAISATGLFLSTGNVQYAADCAYALRKSGIEIPPELADKPLHAVLFRNVLDKMKEVRSPLVDTSADANEHYLLKEVAILEFVNSEGAPEAQTLLNEFTEAFARKDIEEEALVAEVLAKGPRAVSELLWIATCKGALPGMLQEVRMLNNEDADVLAGVLIEKKYSLLEKASPEVYSLIFSHAMRRAALCFAEISAYSEGAEGRAQKGLELYAEMLARNPSIGLPSERKDFQEVVCANLGVAPSPKGFLAGEKILQMLAQNAKDALQVHSDGVRAGIPQPHKRAPPPERKPQDAGKMPRGGSP